MAVATQCASSLKFSVLRESIFDQNWGTLKMTGIFLAPSKSDNAARLNGIMRHCETFVAAFVLLILLMTEVAAQPMEIPLQKTDSYAYAIHTIAVDGCGGTGCFQDATSDEADDPELAIANTTQDVAGGAADDPHASARGCAYQIAVAGNQASANNETSALFAPDLFAENEPGAWANAYIHPGTYDDGAGAWWLVDADEEEDPWIESALVIFANSGPGPGASGLIGTSGTCSGRVDVADTSITYDYGEEEATLHVWGTLMDLDGPHEIDMVSMAPAIVLTARQYVVPGEEFLTGVDQSGYMSVAAHQYQVDGVVGGGLTGEIFTSATLRAYVGTPSTLPVNLPGDYNDDGAVDAADYTVWRDNIGAPSLPNDGGLGTVRDAHYYLWKTQFGASSGSGSGNAVGAIPEPATRWLALVGCLTAALAARRS